MNANIVNQSKELPRFIVGTKAVLFNSEDKILVVLRSGEREVSGAKWSIPGGAVEEGEEPIANLKRKVLKETGLKPENLSLIDITLGKVMGSVIKVGYRGKVGSQEVTLDEKHSDYKFVTKEEALKLDLSEDARHFIGLL